MAQAVITENISVPQGMKTFIILWVGEVISFIGSALTGFALGAWVYQQTGSVTRFSLIVLCAQVPGIIFSPIVGAIVDRHDRRTIMILSNLGAGLSTVTIALLYSQGLLRLWHICILAASISTFASFLRPAFSASVSLLVPKRHLGRASGMIQTGQATAQITAPLLAGVLLLTIKLHGILIIDCLTYIPALIAVLAVSIPNPIKTVDTTKKKPSLISDAIYGWKYVYALKGIFGLLLFFACANFAVTISNILITPLILSFANSAVYGTVLSVTGVGVLAGGLLMTVWGGPKHRIRGVFLYGIVQGLALIFQGIRPNAVLIAACLFCAAATAPIVNGSFVPILQSKTTPEVQGRVFAAVRLSSWWSVPVAYLLAGPLTDKVFEPLLMPDGLLASTVGLVTGVGKGRGIGFLLMLLGVFMLTATVRAYLYPRLRNVEEELPDVLPDVGGSKTVQPEAPASAPVSASVSESHDGELELDSLSTDSMLVDESEARAATSKA
ncbi:MAG TPA: MFS transporter [Pyrinomonadaceae bacterium]|nr:MFS transporter [Pyrinomonadaceae bacterium]